MTFATAVTTCLDKYFDFSGRARRSEYWWFVLAFAAALLVAALVDGFLGMGAFIAITLFSLALPLVAVTVRRLHDTGHTGAWWLVSLVPLGGLVVLYFAAQASAPAANAYGPAPDLHSGPASVEHQARA